MTWLSWSHPVTRPPTPGVMKLTISVNSSFVIITVYLVCLIYAKDQKGDFYRNNAFSSYNLYGYTLAQEPLPRRS